MRSNGEIIREAAQYWLDRLQDGEAPLDFEGQAGSLERLLAPEVRVVVITPELIDQAREAAWLAVRQPIQETLGKVAELVADAVLHTLGVIE